MSKCSNIFYHSFCNFFRRFRQTNMSFLTENRNCQTAFGIRSFPRFDFEPENYNFNQTADTIDWKKNKLVDFSKTKQRQKEGKTSS